MSVFIRNPQVERAARELAQLRKQSLTEAVGDAVEAALALERAKPKPPRTVESMKAATEMFRRAVGLDKRTEKITRADFDALWEIPELDFLDREP
jgi:antitoxin VapB